jgi:hypothetical protein
LNSSPFLQMELRSRHGRDLVNHPMINQNRGLSEGVSIYQGNRDQFFLVSESARDCGADRYRDDIIENKFRG